MSKKNKIWIILGAVLFVALASYLTYYFSNEKPKRLRPNVYNNWDITYDPYSKNPYGTFVLDELLNSLSLGGKFESITERENIELDSNDIFLFIGEEMFLSDDNTDSLFADISNGATGLLVLEKLDHQLIDLLLFHQIQDSYPDSTQNFTFEHSSLQNESYEIIYMDEMQFAIYPWKYISKENIYRKPAEILGTNTNGKINFIRFKLGNGYLFIHTSPLAFTNFNILREEGYEYVEQVFSHLPPGEIQYHHYARQPLPKEDEDWEDSGSPKKSPLDFIMSQKALRWAFFTILIMAFFTVILFSRRKRRPIKIVEKKENISLGKIQTLAQLFMQHKNPAKIVAIKSDNFYRFVSNNYFISPISESDNFDKKLSEKSGIDEDKIAEIRNLLKIYSANCEQNQLHIVHQRIEYFYRNCSVASNKKYSNDSFKEHILKAHFLKPMLLLIGGGLSLLLGISGLVMGYSFGSLFLIIAVALLFLGIKGISTQHGSIKNGVLTLNTSQKESIDLKELTGIKIEDDIIYLRNYEQTVTLNLKGLTDKDRAFFIDLANKYQK